MENDEALKEFMEAMIAGVMADYTGYSQHETSNIVNCCMDGLQAAWAWAFLKLIRTNIDAGIAALDVLANLEEEVSDALLLQMGSWKRANQVMGLSNDNLSQ